MANDGRIYITISDKPLGEGNGGEGKKKESKEKKKNDVLFNQMIHFARQQALQVINNQINTIGNFSGDFNSQRRSQQLVDISSRAINIGIAFAVNPVLGSLSVATSGINFIYQEANNLMAIKKQNYEINQLKAISGLNTLTNGSR